MEKENNSSTYNNTLLKSLDGFFEVGKRKSNFKKEVFGGIIVFLSMAYIIFVQAAILSDGIGIWNANNPGQEFIIPVSTIMIITALTAGVSSIFMGVYAKYPVSLASGMGLNAFVAYSLIPVIGPEAAFTAIFISGLIFIIVSVTGLRKRILNAIPNDIKVAISVGVGFFIVYVALANTGIIVQGNGTPTALGDFSDPAVLLAIFGIVFTLILFILNITNAAIYGIFATVALGLIFNVSGLTGTATPMPSFNFDSLNYSESFGSLGELVFIPFKGMSSASTWTSPEFYLAIFILFLTDFFDTAGTLFSINESSNLEDNESYEKSMNKALKVDATSTMFCSMFGATNVTSYVESNVAISQGSRTGITPIVCGILFLLTIPIIPLLEGLVTSATTAGSLFIVGILMCKNIKRINFDDGSILATTFTIIIFTLLSYSIGTGVVLGLLVYIITMIFTNRYKELDSFLYIISPFLLLFLILPIFI